MHVVGNYSVGEWSKLSTKRKEELYQEDPLDPFIEKKAYEQLLHEIANGIGFY